MDLQGDERVDYLLDERMKIIQSPSVFAFSLDAVLLAEFVYVPIQKGRLLDLCSGNAVIPLLLSERTKGMITGVELQDRIYDMAVRNVKLNHLQERIQMIHGDIKDMPGKLGHGKFDVVTCNPPYFNTLGEQEFNKNEYLAIARHEIYCTLEDVASVSSKLVRAGGKIAFVHRPGRLTDLMTLMRKYNIEPKRIRFIHPRIGKEANMLLIEGIKGGKPDLKVLDPLIVYGEDDNYTKEILQILYGND
jgi:tRNA1(Val) A37 N6-methylase TrmN6